MNDARKKQLIMEYRNRKPEKGIICYKCTATGEAFLMAASDTRTAFNSTTAKLNMDSHPNKHLLQLWKKYGSEGFEKTVVKVLKYEDPHEDYSEKLEAMLQECLDSTENSKRIWK
ncbi:MAG: GIY-YIG nuclease family protein [Clostridia bacterium]|nr:GIY-YIG nuclease family protein [Clostridia bacterium]